jgi:hypothetical protein
MTSGSVCFWSQLALFLEGTGVTRFLLLETPVERPTLTVDAMGRVDDAFLTAGDGPKAPTLFRASNAEATTRRKSFIV